MDQEIVYVEVTAGAIRARRPFEIVVEEIAVRRQLGTCAGAFELSTAYTANLPISPGVEVRIYSGRQGTFLLRAMVETMELELDRSRKSARFRGRETTADLVDCSLPVKPSEYVGYKLADLVRALAGSYGVKLVGGPGPPQPFPIFRVRAGETAWGAIERAGRLRGTLIQGNGKGELEIVELAVASADARLAISENVEAIRFLSTQEERYRTYRVLGQRPGSDLGWGASVALVEGLAEDRLLSRHRELVIVAEASVDGQTATERAQWEATVRAARSTRVSAIAMGWRQSDKPEAVRLNTGLPPDRFWAPNEKVFVLAEPIGLAAEMLIDTVTLRQSRESGTRSEIELARVDAYQPEPVIDAENDPLRHMLDEAEESEE